MNRYDLQFLILAALSLIVGVSLGMVTAASQDHQLAPVHAHINLVGWASLALFGLVYRADLSLSARRMAKVHMMLSAPAAVLLPPAIALVVLMHSEVLAITASFMWLGGCVVFLLQLLSLVSAKEGALTAVPAE